MLAAALKDQAAEWVAPIAHTPKAERGRLLARLLQNLHRLSAKPPPIERFAHSQNYMPTFQ